MKEVEFKTWLAKRGANTEAGRSTRTHAVRTIEKNLHALGSLHADLDAAWDADRFEHLRQRLTDMISDFRSRGSDYRLLMPQSEKPENRLSNWRSWLGQYGQFLAGEPAGDLDADRIRRHVLETYIEPARERDEDNVKVLVRTVNDALGLNDAWPNICQALTGEKFLSMAEVTMPDRIGKKASSATQFVFHLTDTVRFNFEALVRLKQLFLSLHPDFRTFSECPSFAKGEGGYKHLLTARAAELLLGHQDDNDGVLGDALLSLASNKGGLFSNLIDWRAIGMIDEVRANTPGLVEIALGRMVRSKLRPATAVMECVDVLWPSFIEERASKPYAESRMVPTMVMSLVHPDAMFGIRSTPTDNAHRMLVERPAFRNNPLTSAELNSVLAMAHELFRIMLEEWNWAPRDLWDVQGFIWETCQKILPSYELPILEHSSETPMPPPTNLILYGPPGTGKTYTTAREAVALCDGEADFPNTDAGRTALMERYNQLVHDKRIGFVTFHQSMGYEDFVEGLRPETQAVEGDDGSNQAGFRLVPKPGIFREIAKLAEEAAPATGPATAFDMAGRKVFKMSLGRAGVEDHIFQDAIDGNYAVLGWGGEIDWTPFDTYQAIHDRWNQDHPGTNGNDGNIAQTSRFRVDMREGDLIAVSQGNSLVRAVGEITGPYQYDPTDVRDYSHRREVKWLKVFDEPIAVDTFYERPFIQKSCYLLREQFLNRAALANLLAGSGEATSAASNGPPPQYVLIIDEINRANISKVFGELITLLESDKRLGMANALKVRLPYSRREFGVPANLHIIGTMNTADRSIALLDTALRRRFTFREMAPRPDLLGTVDGVNLSTLLTTINQRIEYLIDREHRIGHAFFIVCENRADIDAIMRDKVVPLLQEYFFEDWGRIRAVLGSGFIGVRKLPPPPALSDMQTRESWFVRWDETDAPDAFPANAYALLLTGSEPQAAEELGGAM